MIKRFTYEYDEYNGNLFDNKYNAFYHIEDTEENIALLCKRLNELNQEKNILKSTSVKINEERTRHIFELVKLAYKIEIETPILYSDCIDYREVFIDPKYTCTRILKAVDNLVDDDTIKINIKDNSADWNTIFTIEIKE